jgi:hypothetical protein
MADLTTYPCLTITFSNNIGEPLENIYVFLQSQTQIYSIDTTTFLASPVTSPADGSAPSLKLSQLDNNSFYINAGDDLTSGRIYLSTSDKAVTIVNGTINGPSPTSDFQFDFIELTLYDVINNKGAVEIGKKGINLDTTQIDQFGMPMTVQITPSDDNFPNGTGILAKYADATAVSKESVISNFQSFVGKPGFTAYAECVKSTTPRLLGPQHVIGGDLPQMQFGGSSLTVGSTANTATVTISGTWDNLNPASDKLPSASALTVGTRVVGQGIPPGTTVASVPVNPGENLPWQVEMTSPTGATFVARDATYLSFFPAITSELSKSFDDAVYNMFNYYKDNDLYLSANGTESGMEIYKGRVITDYQLPTGMTDFNGGTDTKYTVFEFTGTGKKYNGIDNSLTPSTNGTGTSSVYQIFYPFFSTNAATSPSNNALTANGTPPPPEWWKPNYDTSLGNIDIISPASNMVFACAGSFADSKYQESAYKKIVAPLEDDTVLGNLENQLVTMLNRGIGPVTGSTSNIEMRVGYIASNAIGPLDPKGTPTSNTLTSPTATSGASSQYTLPGASATATAVIQDSVSGTITLEGGSKQSFSVTGGVFTVAAPVPAVISGTAYVNSTNGGQFYPPKANNNQIQFNWTKPPVSGNWGSVAFKYDCSRILSNKFATVSLIDPYIKEGGVDFYNSGDFGPTSDFAKNIKVGMQMTTLAQFSIPMTVYSMDTNTNSVIVQSALELQPFNTGILTFADFFPMVSDQPSGAWNAFAYYFHEGDLGSKIPTVDGRGYAFPFDDNGGYSSDLSVVLDTTISDSGTVTVDLLPWSS